MATYVSINKENTYNETPDVSQIEVNLDAKSDLDTPTDTRIKVGTGTGRTNKKTVKGYMNTKGKIELEYNIQTVKPFLALALGQTKIVQGEGEIITEIYPVEGSKLPSFCARVGKDSTLGFAYEGVYPGLVIESMDLSADDDLCSATINVNGTREEKAEFRELTNADFPEDTPLAFHETIVKINGVEAEVLNFSTSINNNTDPSAGKRLGSRTPVRIPAKGLDVTAKVGIVFEDMKYKEMLKDEDAYFEVEVIFTQANTSTMSIRYPKCYFSIAPVVASDEGEIVMDCSVEVMSKEITLSDNTIIDTPILVTIVEKEVV